MFINVRAAILPLFMRLMRTSCVSEKLHSRWMSLRPITQLLHVAVLRVERAAHLVLAGPEVEFGSCGYSLALLL